MVESSREHLQETHGTQASRMCPACHQSSIFTHSRWATPTFDIQIQHVHVDADSHSMIKTINKLEGYVILHGSIIPCPFQSLRSGLRWCFVSHASQWKLPWRKFTSPSAYCRHLSCAKRACTRCSSPVAHFSVGVTSPGDSFSPSSFACFASSRSLFSPWPSIECWTLLG